MTCTNPIRTLFILSLLSLATVAAHAQSPSPSMQRKTHKAIIERAKTTFNKYIQFMNSISTPEAELPGDELDIIIDNAFSNDNPSRIFFGYEWQTDRDEDGATPEKADVADIKPYLQAFRNYYKANSANSIGGKLTEDPKTIYIGKERYFIRLYFRQTMNGKGLSGDPYPQQTLKYMDLQVLPKNKEFLTLINKVGFVAKASTRIDAPVVKIEDAFDIGLSDRQYSPAYYDRQLEDGRRSLADQRFDEAYALLKNAQKSPAHEPEASRLINGVYDGLRSKKLVPAEYLYDHLMAKAEMYRDKYRYEDSRRYYEYAKEVKPAATAPVIALEGLSKKEKSLAVLEELLNKHAYQQAIQEYGNALKKEPDNPKLHVGLGRAYTALGNYSTADSFFRAAIRESPTYADIYRHQAEFYNQQSDFDRAFEALRLAQEYTDDPGEPQLLSDIAYFKGKALWAKRQPGALDSLRAAVGYLESNLDAQIALAEVLNDQGSTKEASQQIGKVLKMDNPPASAFRVSGLINRKQERWGDAIKDYTTAVTLLHDEIRWQYELAELLMEQTQPMPSDAREHLNVCIQTPITLTNIVEARQLEIWQQKALLLRARCNYYEGRNLEAEADFKAYFKSKRFPDNESFANYALLLIRGGRIPEATTEMGKAKGQTPNVLLARSILAFMQHDKSYEDLFEEALDRGLKAYEITNAPKVDAMANESKKIKDLLKARRGIRF